MFKSIFTRLLVLGAFLFSFEQVQAQCKAQEKGKNLVKNSGFELGDTLFTAGTYFSWNKNGLQGWSSAGQYWVGNSPTRFNHQGFEQAASAHKGNNMMLVDADCDAGKTVWEQVVYVYPNTNYYFSLWIQSLKDVSPAKLSFEVDGVTLGELVDAPATPGVWKFYEDVWNSGILEGEVHLVIKERSGVNCGSGDDFAIDDISFIPGCEFGAPGPITDLGDDVTICGSGGKITLNSGVAAQNNVTFLWNTGEKTPTIEITQPGIYYVCVDSVSACPRSDVIEVLNDYTIGLQSDVDLCNPATVTLDPGFNAPGVTFKWYKNNQLLGGKTDQQLLVNAPGTYVVQVNEPICGVRSDTIEVTSSAASAGNADFCPPAMPLLSISGPGNYVWYDSPDLTNEVAVGATFDPTGLTQTTTYYVQDTATSKMRVGQPTRLSHSWPFGGRSDLGFVVQAIADVRWDSTTVYPVSWNAGTGVLGITIYDITSGSRVLVDQITRNITMPNNGGNPSDADKIQVNVGISLTGGRRYLITTEGTSNAQFSFHDAASGVTFPYTIPGYLSLLGIDDFGVKTNKYGVFYDWVVTVGSPCKPVQVTATQYCPPLCTMPEFVQLTDIKNLCGENKMLKAIVTPTENYEYEFFRNGVSVQQGSSDSLEITQEGVFKVLVTDPLKSDVCFLESATITIENTTIGVTDLLTGNSPVCEGSSAIYTVPAVTNADFYSWTIPAGATIVGASDGNSITVQFGGSGGIISVTPSNIVCGTGNTESLAVLVDPLPDPITDLSGSQVGCKDDVLTYSFSPVNNATGYVWTLPTGSTIAADNGTSIDLTVGLGSGNLIATPTNACGSGKSDTISLLYSRVPDKVNITGDITTCLGAVAEYTIDSVHNSTSYLWQILGDDVSVVGDLDSTVIKLQLGSKPVKVVITPINNLCGNGEPDTLTINEFGGYVINVDATPKVSVIDLGKSAFIGAEVEGDAPIKYQWYDENKNSISTDPTIEVTPIRKDGGTVNYYIVATDAHGCSALDTAFVKIIRVDLFIPNLITPNNDNKNDYFAITGITPGTKVSIYNRWGQMVYSSDNYDNSWNADNVTDGVYYVHIELGITNEVYKSWLEVLSKQD